MKKKLVILGAAALSAAAAVPALAFENEFHGLYRVKGIVSNFQASGLAGNEGGIKTPAVVAVAPDLTTTPIKPGTAAAPAVLYNGSEALLSTRSRTYSLIEQRARLQYIGKASDDLKLVTHFEIDSTWGDAAYQNGRGIGGGLAADTVNLETKSVYIDFNSGFAPVNFKVGIQPWTDAYKGIFLSDDVGGAVATAKTGAATGTAAFFRTYDQGGTTALGKRNVDVYVADGKIAISRTLSLGGSFYLANNDVNTARQRTYTYGVNAAAKAGVVDLDAFVLYQGGHELYGFNTNTAKNNGARDLEAFAGQVAVKANLGAVSVRAAGLYASGDDQKSSSSAKSFQNIFAAGAPAGGTSGGPGGPAGGGTSSGVYYSSNMLLLLRSAWATDSDNALIASINNKNAGLVAAFVGFDAKISDKFSANINLGHAQVAARNEAVAGSATSRTTSKDIGTEANLQLNYALYPNLTATAQGAYVLLGGYTKAGQLADLKDPYLGVLMLNYTF
jgi:hypothetical protein